MIFPYSFNLARLFGVRVDFARSLIAISLIAGSAH
ncbi:MAG: hypothetical protein ACI9HK_000350, partial [Pirellulaceae bacterium]